MGDHIGLNLQYDLVSIITLLTNLQDPRVDPSVEDNVALRCASENGHKEIVKLLLKDPRVDPSAQDNSAIRYAEQKGYKEIVKLLEQAARVQARLKNIRKGT